MPQPTNRVRRVLVIAALVLVSCGSAWAQDTQDLSATIAALKAQLAEQQSQIDRLTAAVAELSRQPAADREPERVRVASLSPLVGVESSTSASTTPIVASSQDLQNKVEEVGKRVEDIAVNLAGFRFSGDFRLRADAQLRSGNAVAGPLQNIRSRYRLRLNVAKDIDRSFRFHVQMSTAPMNNGITNDQDMAGTIVKHPFSIAEAYVDYHPRSWISLRAGRMEEVFADNMRFLWDDDVRFNGFNQVITVPFAANDWGFRNIEFRSGEYILTNPNAPVLASSSPLTSAGYQPGEKVRAANLFHPGFIVRQDLSGIWNHQIGSDFQYYRNVNQIQLASTANGFPVLVNGTIGLSLSGPTTGTGNATTTPGGAMFSAPSFKVVRGTYRIQHRGVRIGTREMPLFFDFQVSRNTGTTYQRDAFMGSVNFGVVRNTKDWRLLYQFSLKQANSMISQFTDDDLGTGTGVNIRVHALRADVGLARFLQWQNLFFIQEALSWNDPARSFFVPIQAGANRTYRYLGQLAFTF